jgi:hypothetical protein
MKRVKLKVKQGVYIKPTLIKLGCIKDITLKTGSVADFGGQYTP